MQTSQNEKMHITNSCTYFIEHSAWIVTVVSKETSLNNAVLSTGVMQDALLEAIHKRDIAGCSNMAQGRFISNCGSLNMCPKVNTKMSSD